MKIILITNALAASFSTANNLILNKVIRKFAYELA